jgi:hypothetical protein
MIRAAYRVLGDPGIAAWYGHDLLIRSNGQTVQNRPVLVTCRADVPGLSYRVGSWPRSWQQVWQQPGTGLKSSLAVCGVAPFGSQYSMAWSSLLHSSAGCWAGSATC